MKTWHTFYVDELPADEVEYEAYIHITSFGSGPSWYDPGDPPEYEIESIYSDGKEIPVHLPVRWRDRFEAWFNDRPVRKRLNPEWERLATKCDESMERFDWGDAQRAADEAWYDV
jgi:hypothetical protein